jgi:aryl-alcohol dehydrogenase-like predicted oxidoreductase
MRARMPRFTGENLERNRALVETLRSVASEHGVTATQLAIAWELSRGSHIVPLIGARTRAQLDEAFGALDVELTPDHLAKIERAVPAEAVAGTRYDARQMAALDSERRG